MLQGKHGILASLIYKYMCVKLKAARSEWSGR